MNDLTPLEQYMEGLRQQVEKGHLLEGLELHPGWKVVVSELEEMLAAYKSDAVSAKYLNNPTGHAALVGAHNAIQSLLTMIEKSKAVGVAASEQVKQVEEDSKEEVDRLGIQTKI